MLTLANATGLIVDTLIDASRLNGVQIEKMWNAISVRALTPTEGPVLYGLAKNVGTVSQLKEFLEADPQGPSNTAEIKKTDSDVFILGWLPRSDLANASEGLRRIRFPWKKFGEDDKLSVWVFNDTGSAMTTGALVKFQTVIAGHWMDD